MPLTPVLTPAFVAGIWTGSVTFTAPSTVPVTLQARQGYLFGQSTPISVAPAPDSDAYGLPDAGEDAHGLDPASSDGAQGRLGDLDGDGLPNLLEYAFGLDPLAADPSPFSVAAAAHPGTDAKHLVVTYRRLLAPGSLVYTLQTSSDLLTWASPASSPEVLGAAPNADGLTETVTVRINPALGTAPSFVRVQVSTP